MFNGHPGVVYAMVIAHNEGQADERLVTNTLGTWAQAQAHVDTWQRRHGHRKNGTVDKCGFYAYVDRANRPGFRIPVTV